MIDDGPAGDASADQPHVPASVSLPEITVKALLLGAVLAIVLGAANVYLGLKVGMTVSASIPAAVVSMALLRLFRRSNILENNIVQTAASAGESLAAGVIFTIPALVLLGAWEEFDYWKTTTIALFGGLLGVLFTVPLRRALIVENPLRFPEGLATAEVLKVGDGGGRGIAGLLIGGAMGGLFKLGATGAQLWSGAVHGTWTASGRVFALGSEVAPALVGVGYIVGLNIAVLVFLGGAMNWLVAIPIISVQEQWQTALAGGTPLDVANEIWSTQTRYIGVGAMLVGGVWALLRLWRSVVRGVASSFRAYSGDRDAGGAVPRTERDAPMKWMLVAAAVSIVPLVVIYRALLSTGVESGELTTTGVLLIAAFMAVVMLVAGFLFSAVAAYMAGLVGSSNNPISGVTIATVLCAALLLLLFLGTGSAIGPTAAISIGAVVCCAAAIGGDNMQDLKAGYVLGATPYRQQIMQVVGVVASAFSFAWVLSLMDNAYGIGSGPEDQLAAPQAGLMAAVAGGVFGDGLPWTMIGIGAVTAVGIIVADLALAARNSAFRMPVLAVAVGIYLPFELTVPIFIGGLIAWAAKRLAGRPAQSGLLLAAGLITGEALVGILLAIPLVAWGGTNHLAVFDDPPGWPGVVLLGVVCAMLLRSSVRKSL